MCLLISRLRSEEHSILFTLRIIFTDHRNPIHQNDMYSFSAT